MSDLDAIDLRILRVMQSDARISNVELAEQVGLSQSPCLRRVRKLQDLGVIANHVTLLDQNAVGLPVSVFLHVFVVF